MIWNICLFLSIGIICLSLLFSFGLSRGNSLNMRFRKIKNIIFVSAFLAVYCLYIPIFHEKVTAGLFFVPEIIIYSLNATMRTFTLMDISFIIGSVNKSTDFYELYTVYMTVLSVLSPILSVGYVFSFIRGATATLQFSLSRNRDMYVFSQLNSESIALAMDIKRNHRKAAIVFADVKQDSSSDNSSLTVQAQGIHAVLFKKGIFSINFRVHSKRKNLYFFTISDNEELNVDQALKLFKGYGDRENTFLYVFSTSAVSDLLVSGINDSKIRVRRVNREQAVVNNILYTKGNVLFDKAFHIDGKTKKISAVVIGLGKCGVEMVKALSWYCQMDGYTLEVNAFDSDPSAGDRFTAECPELMDEKYNGKNKDGDAHYKINIHAGVAVNSLEFSEKLKNIGNITYTFVSLGDDNADVAAASYLRMLFERMKIHPVIHAVVHNSDLKNSLEDLSDFHGQSYDINFLGDSRELFSEAEIINSELEENALRLHKLWGDEKLFWSSEYYYRSSVSSAIHRQARIFCKVKGYRGDSDELTEQDIERIRIIEHKRWNAYMRAEGFVYSGSTEGSTRNNLAKKHNLMVPFDELSDSDKEKDFNIEELLIFNKNK